MLIAQELARGTLDVSESVKNRLYSCTLCKACELACPSLVKVSDAMMELRENFYKEAIGPLDVDQELINRFRQDGTPFGPPKPPSEVLNLINLNKKDADILLFFGCTILNSYPQFGVSLANIFQKTNNTFTILDEESCCAGFLKMSGAKDLFDEAKQQLGSNIEKKAVNTVITHCPTCYTMLKDFGIDPEVQHFTQYFSKLIDEGQLQFSKPDDTTVVSFHDPCHLGRWSNEYEAPRRILRTLPGFVFREMSTVGAELQGDKSICCGGPIRLAFREFRDHMAEQNIYRADEMDSTTLLTACPTCYHNLNSAAFVADKEIKDLVVLLDELL